MQTALVADDRKPIYITAILRKEKTDKDDHSTKYPIWIRCAMDGNKVYRSTGYFATKKQWDKAGQSAIGKHHEQASAINTEIALLKGEINKRHAYFLATGVGDLRSIVHGDEEVSSSAGNIDISMKTDVNLFAFLEDRIKYLQKTNGKAKGTISTWNVVLNRLSTYLGDKELRYSDLNLKFIQDWTVDMFDSGYHQNTVLNSVIKLHTFCTMLRTEFKITIEEYNPFAGYEFPKRLPSPKDRLTLDELDLFLDYAENGQEEDVMVRIGRKRLDGTWSMRPQVKGKKQAAIYFLLGCYTGLRHSDWRSFDVKKHVVCENGVWGIKGLVALKNKKPVVMQLHDNLKRVIELIKLHPYTMDYDDTSSNLKAVAEELGIDKKVTTHVGRKTFAVTMCAENQISCETCATLMAINISTCMKSYYEVTIEKISKETEAWGRMDKERKKAKKKKA